MAIFPPVETANEDGLLAIGGNLDVDTLVEAYSCGVFPWPVSKDFPLTWFAPDPRGILETSDYKAPKSLKKFVSKCPYQIRFNKDFDQIIEKCANAKRKHESGTWINEDIIKGYKAMFKAGRAFSVGSYDNEELVGGLYGVCVGEIVSGESMFYKKDNASKVALLALIERLKERGIPHLDTQMVTPVVGSLGGKEVPRAQFMQKLGLLDTKRPRSEIFGS